MIYVHVIFTANKHSDTLRCMYIIILYEEIPYAIDFTPLYIHIWNMEISQRECLKLELPVRTETVGRTSKSTVDLLAINTARLAIATCKYVHVVHSASQHIILYNIILTHVWTRVSQYTNNMPTYVHTSVVGVAKLVSAGSGVP